MLTRSLKEEKRQEINVPIACVSISFRATFPPPLPHPPPSHIHTLEDHYMYTTEHFDLYIINADRIRRLERAPLSCFQ